MTDIHKKIIEYIKEDKSMREIADILNISEKQLYVRIKQIIAYGYQIIPSYNYSSDIKYKLSNELEKEERKNSVTINIPSLTKEFRCLAISDIHIGNIKSNIEFVKKVYEYASNNDINIILNCGDLIEGDYSTDKKSISDIYKQIEELIKKYPYDKNIRTFTILGNHDYHALHYNNIDISKTIANARYDIIPIGFGKGIVNISNDSLLLQHELSVVENPEICNNSKIILVGHGHEMKTKIYDKLLLCVPTLSNVTPDKTQNVVPGMLDITLYMKHGRFDYLSATHFIIDNKVIEVSQTRAKIKFLKNEYK